MEKLITYENLRNYAYSSDKICSKPIRAVAVNFLGLNGCGIYNEDPAEAVFFKDHGILYVVPYTNPWSWMNGQALEYTEEVLDVLFEKYSLPDDIPIISMGGSMGGLSGIVYAKYAKRTPIAVVANCPVCDLVSHFNERRDVQKSLYSAFWYETGNMEKALEAHSPLHLAESLPDIPYHVFHCTDDKSVNIDKHSRRFVDKMRSLGRDITFDIVEGRGHCELTDEMKNKYLTYVAQEAKKRRKL